LIYLIGFGFLVTIVATEENIVTENSNNLLNDSIKSESPVPVPVVEIKNETSEPISVKESNIMKIESIGQTELSPEDTHQAAVPAAATDLEDAIEPEAAPETIKLANQKLMTSIVILSGSNETDEDLDLSPDIDIILTEVENSNASAMDGEAPKETVVLQVDLRPDLDDTDATLSQVLAEHDITVYGPIILEPKHQQKKSIFEEIADSSWLGKANLNSISEPAFMSSAMLRSNLKQENSKDIDVPLYRRNLLSRRLNSHRTRKHFPELRVRGTEINWVDKIPSLEGNTPFQESEEDSRGRWLWSSLWPPNWWSSPVVTSVPPPMASQQPPAEVSTGIPEHEIIILPPKTTTTAAPVVTTTSGTSLPPPEPTTTATTSTSKKRNLGKFEYNIDPRHKGAANSGYQFEPLPMTRLVKKDLNNNQLKSLEILPIPVPVPVAGRNLEMNSFPGSPGVPAVPLSQPQYQKPACPFLKQFRRRR